MKVKAQQGFNLIELMIVVVIIGILAAVSLPGYVQEYSVRAKIVEGVLLANGLKAAIDETFLVQGPSDMTCNDEPSCAAIGANHVSRTKYVVSVESDDSGIIRITFDASVLPPDEKIIAIAPAFPSGTPFSLQGGSPGTAYVWDCGRASASAGIEGAGVAGGTNVLNKYLPQGCRQ